MKIRVDQRQVLDSLTIERISDNADNVREIGGFDNRHISEKKCALRNNAAQDDESGVTAYYLIKDEHGALMFYFSLKCGMLYDGQLYANVLERERSGFLEYAKERGLMSDGSWLAQDVVVEKNEMITKGEHTFPAIELSHFYRNDNYNFKAWRERFDLPQVGTIIFWRFVVPCVLKVRKHIGCQYLYLFAADDSENRKLVNYYADKLKFRTQVDVGTIKPVYDYACEFMCQEIAPLQEKMVKFFEEEFNPDADVV